MYKYSLSTRRITTLAVEATSAQAHIVFLLGVGGRLEQVPKLLAPSQTRDCLVW